MLWLAPLLCGVVSAGSIYAPTPNAVHFVGNELYVDGKPFFINGLCYSPVPIGETVEFYPFGDYFTSDYAYIWRRDLPLIKSMGVNTIRIYGWDTTHNITHYEFLDEVQRYGLKVVLTFYVARNNDKPPFVINSTESRQAPITNFTRELALYGDHPAILMWSFGNELNGPWNGFLKQLAKLGGCNYPGDYNNCWNTETLSNECLVNADCLYKNFFGFLNDAAVQAKPFTTRPVTSGLADLDRIVDKNAKQTVSKIQLYGKYAPDLAAWALQLYKGDRFGSYLKYFQNAVADNFKPLVVTEYGVDAYNDPCGWLENRGKQKICKNMVGDRQGGPDLPKDGSAYIGCENSKLACANPGTDTQAKWDISLAKELWENRIMAPGSTQAPSPKPNCTGPYPSSYNQCDVRMQWFQDHWQEVSGVTADRCSWQAYLYDENNYCPDPWKTNAGLGVVLGGFLMAWADERWKGNIPTQAYCKFPCNASNLDSCYARAGDFEKGGAAKCTDGSVFNQLAHWECIHDTYYHGLCGYGFESMPDFYMNEEWFGVTVPAQCGHSRPPHEPNQNPQMYGLDALVETRPVMKTFQEFWNPTEFALGQPFRSSTCAELLPCWQCLQDNFGTNAFKTTCATQCNINPPAPTPGSPTMSTMAPSPETAPTVAAPTDANSTMPPTPEVAPTEMAPTPKAPTNPAPTQQPPAPTSAMVDMPLLVTFRLTNHSVAWEKDTVGAKFVEQVGKMINMDLKGRVSITEISLAKAPLVSANLTFRIEASSKPGDKTSQQIFDMIKAQLALLSKDPSYGCTQDCTPYSWPADCEAGNQYCLIRMLDSSFAQAQAAPSGQDTTTQPAETGPSTTTIIIIVVCTIVALLVVVGVVAFFRKKGGKGDHYSPVTDENYVPPQVGTEVN